MSIRYFYNIRLVQRDSIDLHDDILSAVRKSYFDDYGRIKDKITVDSDGETVSYEYAIEKDRAMKWLVRDKHGYLTEESKPSEGGRYYVLVYKDGGLFKRLTFSKFHTLLKVEYFDTVKGEIVTSIEPRRAPSGLCILMKSLHLNEPLVLYSAPEVSGRVKELVDKEFTQFYVEASTDEGVLRFMTESQNISYRELIEDVERQLENEEKQAELHLESAPLADRLKAKDFNIKKNLASSLDITKAQEFISEYEETDDEVIIPDTDQKTPIDEPQTPDVPAEDTESSVEEEANLLAQKVAAVLSSAAVSEVRDDREPDKVVEAEDESFYYYGELDDKGRRSGFGRTVTSSGRTAYEGSYLDDKRTGIGSYYYKDGSLCYTGEWKENSRSGVGVGRSSKDGSIHVGVWEDNRPKGSGARLSADGSPKFVCKELGDHSTVLLNFMNDDSITVSKYDETGKKIGEKTLSIKDLLK